MKKISILLVLFATIFSFARERWTQTQANDWYKQYPYLAGVNYVPSTAINTIEIWSEESFDATTIDKELKIASELGFNTVRVFLNDQVWKHNPETFYKNVEKFLDIAEKRGIYVMFTFFTNGGHPEGKYGKQPAPKGTHNSGWVKSPILKVLLDDSQWGYLEEYVTGVVKRFANDKRVLLWDIFNEPGNVKSEHVKQVRELKGDEVNLGTENTKKLMIKGVEWARAANPSQPISIGIWESPRDVSRVFDPIQIELSDVMTYHSYGNLISHARFIERLQKQNRPILCTEWMARHRGSTFMPILEFLKSNNVGSYSFGLVTGKIQTELIIDFLLEHGGKSAKGINDVWFHDIFDQNGKPYSQEEVDYIKRILKR